MESENRLFFLIFRLHILYTFTRNVYLVLTDC
jgi:hypothetical protein